MAFGNNGFESCDINEEGLRGLMVEAVNQNKLSLLENLLNNPERIEKYGHDVFLHACGENKPLVVKWLLDFFKKNQIAVSAINGLRWAYFKHNIEVIKVILNDKEFPVFSKGQRFVKGPSDNARNDGAVTIEYKAEIHGKKRCDIVCFDWRSDDNLRNLPESVFKEEVPQEWIKFFESATFVNMLPGAPIRFQDEREHADMFASLQNIARIAMLTALFYDVLSLSDISETRGERFCSRFEDRFDNEQRRTKWIMAEALADIVKFDGVLNSAGHMKTIGDAPLREACRVQFDELVVELLKNKSIAVTGSFFFARERLHTIEKSCLEMAGQGYAFLDTFVKLLEDERIAKAIVKVAEEIFELVGQRLTSEKELLNYYRSPANRSCCFLSDGGYVSVIAKHEKDIEKLEGIRDWLDSERLNCGEQRKRVREMILKDRCPKACVFFKEGHTQQVLGSICLDSVLSELKAGTALPENNTPKPT